MERTPAVAGTFYPADPALLSRTVTTLLEGAGPLRRKAIAVLVPHAGLAYSGATAGRTWGAVEIPSRVLLLGPNHTGLGRPAAIWSRGRWLTPLGAMPIDAELATALLDATPLLEADTAAHRHEHSLEVQIPFLQRLRPDARIVPICIADLGAERLLDLGGAVAAVLAARRQDVLVAISSDMTHYESRAAARRMDAPALERLLAVDAEGLYRVVGRDGITMCGVAPAVVGLAAASRLGATAGHLVDTTCSGDVTGDDSSVVSYAGLTVS
jgi:MEMO1 family protein